MNWLLKSEPAVYSIDQLKSDKRTHWDHIRNFQARNYLRQMKKGDIALFYHSQDGREIVGLTEVVKEHYPDPDPEQKGDWVQVDVAFKDKFKTPVTLDQIKKTPALKSIALIRQSRLSVMPITDAELKVILKLSTAPSRDGS